MDKGLLFQFMRVKFREAGFTDAEVELHMQSFSERYQNKTDEEIEADIKRRGGASRVAAATVERRNTVLMADPDYRAFVASAKETQKTEAPKTESRETPEVKPSSEQLIITETPASAETPVTAEEDPLAAWFSAPSEKNAETETQPSLFEEPVPEKQAGQAKSVEVDASTAEVPVVKPVGKPAGTTAEPASGHAPGTVHEIPLFAQPSHGQPSVPHAQGTQPLQRAPISQKPAADADLGRTRIVNVQPTEGTAKPMPAPMPPRPANKTYQDEQRAIWSGGSDIRDSRGSVSRPTAAPQPQRTVGVHNAPKPQPQKSEKQKIAYADRGNVTRLQEKTYWGEGSEEGVRRFRIILGVSALPIAVLLLAYAVIALGLIVLMPVLMAVFVIGLVVWVAVGSLVALVAVIYGVSQLFIVMPIGMFELGLGVAAIGVTMFIGILMYNIAVRLLPFLLRQFIRFQSVFKGFLQDLYYYVKGECYRR